jgi:hypothetical protein
MTPENDGGKTLTQVAGGESPPFPFVGMLPGSLEIPAGEIQNALHFQQQVRKDHAARARALNSDDGRAGSGKRFVMVAPISAAYVLIRFKRKGVHTTVDDVAEVRVDNGNIGWAVLPEDVWTDVKAGE